MQKWMLKNFEPLVKEDINEQETGLIERMADEIDRIAPSYVQEWEDARSIEREYFHLLSFSCSR